jgi:1,5-anhydro-D-fructose reductase (1,5-anhydro-D-mannitol-forming)
LRRRYFWAEKYLRRNLIAIGDVMKWGIVGASTIAREWMIGAIRANGGEILSLLSHDAVRGAAYAQAHGIAHVFTELDAFIESGLDAIYIGSTNAHHRAPTLAAAARGIHVLCDKPLATTLNDVREMIAACSAAKVVLATNHHLRNAPAHVAMRTRLRDGAIGELIAMRVFHAVYLPPHLQTWRLSDPSAGAGVILDITVHDVDTMRFYADAEPLSVSAISQNRGLAAPGIEDGVMCQWEFAGGIIAQSHEGFTSQDAPTGFELLGTKGSLVGRGIMSQKPVGTVTLQVGGQSSSVDYAPRNLYEISIERFYAAVRGDGTPAASGIDGFASLAGALAAAESARRHARVPIAFF